MLNPRMSAETRRRREERAIKDPKTALMTSLHQGAAKIVSR